jgi:hypothetical protein
MCGRAELNPSEAPDDALIGGNRYLRQSVFRTGRMCNGEKMIYATYTTLVGDAASMAKGRHGVGRAYVVEHP